MQILSEDSSGLSCTLLAIESSCDETSASVLRNGVILSNIIANQEVHAKYGGVVPELASREHQKNILPVVTRALSEANVHKMELNAIAFTKGPGLLGSLLVGTSFAKAMALALNIPLIEVHHMQAHVLAHFIPLSTEPGQGLQEFPVFPFLCLTVSGGHTQIVRVEDHLKMEIIGQTQDDAVGEAFDKAAKLLQLPYPGGPLIDRYASQGDPAAFSFPEADMPGLDFSFSGVKTALLYFLQEKQASDKDFVFKNLPDICASYQHTLVSMLMKKLKKAARHTGIRDLALAGGVSANSMLRKKFGEEGKRSGWRTFIPPLEYCTDNAAMIAIAAWYKFRQGLFSSQETSPMPRMKF